MRINVFSHGNGEIPVFAMRIDRIALVESGMKLQSAILCYDC